MDLYAILFETPCEPEPAPKLTRFFGRCRWCGERFVVESTDFITAVGSHSCERAERWRASFRHQGKSDRQANSELSYRAVKFATVNWKDEGPNASTCDGRCMNAKGPNCDCYCGGKNHGKGSLPASMGGESCEA